MFMHEFKMEVYKMHALSEAVYIESAMATMSGKYIQNTYCQTPRGELFYELHTAKGISVTQMS